MGFRKGFEKAAAAATAGFWQSPKKLDKAGLVALGVSPAYHAVKAVKENNKTEAGIAATEGAGLGLLYRAVSKAKH